MYGLTYLPTLQCVQVFVMISMICLSTMNLIDWLILLINWITVGCSTRRPGLGSCTTSLAWTREVQAVAGSARPVTRRPTISSSRTLSYGCLSTTRECESRLCMLCSIRSSAGPWTSPPTRRHQLLIGQWRPLLACEQQRLRDKVCDQHLISLKCVVVYRVATHLENLEKSGNLRLVREKSAKMCSCMHEIWPIGSQENHWNWCHQVWDFKTKMHQIWFRLGLTALPWPVSEFKGAYF